MTTGNKQDSGDCGEWTPEHCTKYFGVSEKLGRDISFAIKAALAAAKDWSPIAAENVKLTQQLAAEREKREQAEQNFEISKKAYQRVLDQLLQSQAAIAEHNKCNEALAKVKEGK